MKKETKAYLAEAAAPSLLGGKVQKEALAFLDLTGRLDQQAAHWMRLLQAAEITETDEQVRARFEEHMGTLRALRREVGEAEREFREVMQALQHFGRVTGWLQEAADEQS